MKDGKQEHNHRTTRRKLLRLAGMAAVAGAAVTSKSYASEATAAQNKGRIVTASSVFLTCKPTGVSDKDESNKYTNGDSAVVYPLVALWAMMITEEWRSCLDDDNWFKALQEELISHNATLTDKEKDAFRSGAATFLAELKKVGSQWDAIRGIFKRVVQNNSVYGGRPCAGPRTILDIAALVPPKK